MTFHTVTEAKTKWCPLVRLNSGNGVFNRLWATFKDWAEGKDKQFMQNQEDACKCVASDCMFWQWMTNTQSGAGCSGGRDGRDEWASKSGGRSADGDPIPPPGARGYCGAVR